MNLSLSRLFASLLPLAGAGLFAAAGCVDAASTGEEDTDSAGSALTAEQCSHFDINGKVQICHKTSSTTRPYTILRLSEEACIHGHVAHGGDYVTSTDPSSPLYDPTCQGGGCLPVDAPCDATLPCCDGSTCTDGVCAGTPPDPCDGVTCVAIDDCHVAGTCDSETGACSTPTAADGTVCDDGSGCTLTDACSGGACSGSGDPCLNGATCSSSNAGYTCCCAPGWTGTSCDVPESASCPCATQDPAGWASALSFADPDTCYSDGVSFQVFSGPVFFAYVYPGECGMPFPSSFGLNGLTEAETAECMTQIAAACQDY